MGKCFVSKESILRQTESQQCRDEQNQRKCLGRYWLYEEGQMKDLENIDKTFVGIFIPSKPSGFSAFCYRSLIFGYYNKKCKIH